MAKMTLEEFITQEVSQVMDFASAWREHNEKDAKLYPLEMSHIYGWYKQYLAYTARMFEQSATKELSKAA